jgi:hypothetical protein
MAAESPGVDDGLIALAATNVGNDGFACGGQGAEMGADFDKIRKIPR